MTLSTVATDAASGVAQVALSNDDANCTTRPYATSQAWTLPAANGVRTVWAKSRDGAGLKAPDRGKAKVLVNGAVVATVDLYSKTAQKQLVVWSANYATSATRTVTIKVLGTTGRPRVDVDGFALLPRPPTGVVHVTR